MNSLDRSISGQFTQYSLGSRPTTFFNIAKATATLSQPALLLKRVSNLLSQRNLPEMLPPNNTGSKLSMKIEHSLQMQRLHGGLPGLFQYWPLAPLMFGVPLLECHLPHPTWHSSAYCIDSGLGRPASPLHLLLKTLHKFQQVSRFLLPPLGQRLNFLGTFPLPVSFSKASLKTKVYTEPSGPLQIPGLPSDSADTSDHMRDCGFSSPNVQHRDFKRTFAGHCLLNKDICWMSSSQQAKVELSCLTSELLSIVEMDRFGYGTRSLLFVVYFFRVFSRRIHLIQSNIGVKSCAMS